jgi:hypothetical protein
VQVQDYEKDEDEEKEEVHRSLSQTGEVRSVSLRKAGKTSEVAGFIRGLP